MECKCYYIDKNSVRMGGFNRYIVECKSNYDCKISCVTIDLIDT